MSERYTRLDSIKVDGVASTSQQGALIGASKVMPQPSADLDGVTIQYMGPTDSTYTFKRMYTCAMVGSEYKWIDATPVDVVQNSNGVFIAGTEIGVADSTKYGVMSPEQSEKVDSSFEKLETVKEGAEPNKVDIIRVEGTPLQVSGVDKSVNITRDSLGLGDSAQLDVGTLEGQIPVLGANGQLPKSTIPPYATGTYVGSVRTKALLTSLTTAEIGDWAKVTSDDDFNNNGAYILNGTAPGVLTNWVQMVGPANVESVNGKSGRVVLDKEDIGLANVDNTSDAKKPISEATQSALNDCVKLSGSDSAQVITNGGLQLPNGDLSVGGGALVGKDTEPALLRVRGSIEATQSISGQLVQTENVASNDNSTKVASTAWVASADSVVHKTGNETIGGTKTFSQDIVSNSQAPITCKKTDMDMTKLPARDIGCYIPFQDKNGVTNTQILSIYGSAGNQSIALNMRARDSEKWVSMSLVSDSAGIYAKAPSWSAGTADNSDKILTTKMANSLPSLVHTTGNEEIAGTKTFSVPTVDPRKMVARIDTPNSGSSEIPYYKIAEFNWDENSAYQTFIVVLKVNSMRGTDSNSEAKYAIKLVTTTGAAFSRIFVSRMNDSFDGSGQLTTDKIKVYYNPTNFKAEIWFYESNNQKANIISLDQIGNRFLNYISSFKMYDNPAGVASAHADGDGWILAECNDLSGIAEKSTPIDAVGKEIVTADWALAKIAELTARIEALEGAR